MIRTRKTTWTVQTCAEDRGWTTIHEGQRFADAVQIYNAADTIHKRMLRDGRPLRLATDPTTQLDLLHEEES
jgi:hypothetical protein